MHPLVRHFWWPGVIGAIAFVMAFGARFVHSQNDAPPGGSVSDKWESVVEASHADLQFLGSRSCASTACHGAISPDPGSRQIGRNEFMQYWENDPHARAHETLSEPRSLEMFEALGVMREGEILAEQRLEFEAVYARCAACHSMQFTPPSSTAPLPGQEASLETIREEGVSCELCHGPAADWIERHYRRGFAALSPREKSQFGMIDTGDLWVRSRMCASCHVGSEHREVSHDFIAAGHPVLKFEMAAYWSQLPPHWKPARDRAKHVTSGGAAYELQLWVAGQLSTADAALGQLQSRALHGPVGSRDKVWPEFAENDCYACHHDLAPPGNWRQQRGFTRSQDLQVVAAWSQWNMGLVEELAEQDGSQPAQGFQTALQNLRETMQSGWNPPPEKAESQATAAKRELAAWASTLRLDRFQPSTVTRSLNPLLEAPSGPAVVDSWDQATQVYLALKVLERSAMEQGSRRATSDDPLDMALRSVRDQLAFPVERGKAYDSPRQFAGVIDGSEPSEQPATRQTIQRSLVEIFQDLQTR